MKIRYVLPLFVSTAVFSATFVEVTGNNVNLRSAPGLPSDVVGQVSKGEVLELLGSVEDAWVKVAPPSNVDLWVASQYVENGIVTGNRVRVRAGANVNYKDVGIVDKGSKLEVRGRVGDWIKIAPPEGSFVWITNAYVKATGRTNVAAKSVLTASSNSVKPTQTITTSTTTTTTTTTTQPVVKVAPKPQKVAPVQPPKTTPNVSQTDNINAKKVRRTFFDDKTDLDKTPVGPAKVPKYLLRNDYKQAVYGSYTGRLTPAPKNAPAKYQLVRDIPGSKLTKTECYIIGNAAQLKSIVGQSFTFEGAVYWFNGTSIPTVYTQGITRVR